MGMVNLIYRNKSTSIKMWRKEQKMRLLLLYFAANAYLCES